MPAWETAGWHYYQPDGAPQHYDPQLVGKWMLFGSEQLWDQVVSAMEDGRITAMQAKTVLPGHSSGGGVPVVIYTSNYKNLHEVLRVGMQVRNELGITRTIPYKLDVRTYAGEYGKDGSFYQLRGDSLVLTHTQQVLLEAEDLVEAPQPGEHMLAAGLALAAVQAVQAHQQPIAEVIDLIDD